MISTIHAANDTATIEDYSDNSYDDRLDELANEDIKKDNSKNIHKLTVNDSKQLGDTLSNIRDNDSYYIYYNKNSWNNENVTIGDVNSNYNPRISVYANVLWGDSTSQSNVTMTIYSGNVNFKYLSFIKCSNTNYTITNYANLTLSDAYLCLNDNFIRNYGNITINKCEIKGNVAGDSFISNQKGKLSITKSYFYINNCQIVDNNASVNITSNCFSGHRNTTLKSDASGYYSFINNRNGATLTVGYNTFLAFRNESCSIITNHGNLSVEGNLFNRNNVKYIISNYALANITENEFRDNNAVRTLILNEFDKDILIKEYLYIKSNNFNSNTGVNGAILFNRAKAIFNNNNCSNNRVSSNGGCLFNGGRLITHVNSFRSNNASNGGAIYNINLLDSSKDYFNHNVALSGGCIYNRGVCNVISSVMKFSYALNGSVIYNEHANMTLIKSNINKNKAMDCGIIYTNGTLTLRFNTFCYNKAFYGGSVYNNNLLYSFNNAYKFSVADRASVMANLCSTHIIASYNQSLGKNLTIYVPESTYSGCVCLSSTDVFTLNKALDEATILNDGYMQLSGDMIKTLGVNNYLIVNEGTLILKNTELINYDYIDETLVKNGGKIYNSTC